jgi:hypothetical protein
MTDTAAEVFAAWSAANGGRLAHRRHAANADVLADSTLAVLSSRERARRGASAAGDHDASVDDGVPPAKRASVAAAQPPPPRVLRDYLPFSQHAWVQHGGVDDSDASGSAACAPISVSCASLLLAQGADALLVDSQFTRVQVFSDLLKPAFLAGYKWWRYGQRRGERRFHSPAAIVAEQKQITRTLRSQELAGVLGSSEPVVEFRLYPLAMALRTIERHAHMSRAPRAAVYSFGATSLCVYIAPVPSGGCWLVDSHPASGAVVLCVATASELAHVLLLRSGFSDLDIGSALAVSAFERRLAERELEAGAPVDVGDMPNAGVSVEPSRYAVAAMAPAHDARDEALINASERALTAASQYELIELWVELPAAPQQSRK